MEIILIKNGEIALKGMNRRVFEDILMKNIRFRLKPIGKFKVDKFQSTIYITPQNDEVDFQLALNKIEKIFGIATFSRALVTTKDFEQIKLDSIDYLKDTLENAKTFRVSAKRADKTYPLTSPQIGVELGATLLEAYPHLSVDLHNPDITVTVEIREKAYVHAKVLRGAGGMPVSSSGEGLLLISGGIDSPVAGYMMARRGMKLSAIHFVSPPYTSDRALDKVVTLCKKVADYSGSIQFFCVNITKIQEAIRDHCNEEYFTIILRRIMMEIAIHVAEENNIPALITGESLAQVASQTVYALAGTNEVADRPVLRPLIGMDKQDIIDIARKIDTFDTSILPYEDCCTIFTPKHPKTRPTRQSIRDEHSVFDFSELIQQAIDEITVQHVNIKL